MKLFSRNPTKALQKQYEAKMKEAMEAQRSGNIQLFSALNTEAEKLLAQIQSHQTSTP